MLMTFPPFEDVVVENPHTDMIDFKFSPKHSRENIPLSLIQDFELQRAIRFVSEHRLDSIIIVYNRMDDEYIENLQTCLETLGYPVEFQWGLDRCMTIFLVRDKISRNPVVIDLNHVY